MAWQFDRPEADAGVIQAFRRHESFYEAVRLRLRGLDADADYIVTDIETGHDQRHPGQKLLTDGLRITLDEKPAAAVLTYRKAK